MSFNLYLRTQAVQAVVDKFARKPLEYGDYDCGKLAEKLLMEMGYPALPISWTTPKQALRKVRKAGYSSITEAIEKHYELERIAPASAHIGDLLGVKSGDPLFEYGFGVVVDAETAIGFVRPIEATEEYYMAWFFLRKHADMAWRLEPRFNLDAIAEPSTTAVHKLKEAL